MEVLTQIKKLSDKQCEASIFYLWNSYIDLPEVIAHGKLNEMEFIVLPKYGRTLKDILLSKVGKRCFPLKTVATIGLQIVSNS